MAVRFPARRRRWKALPSSRIFFLFAFFHRPVVSVFLFFYAAPWRDDPSVCPCIRVSYFLPFLICMQWPSVFAHTPYGEELGFRDACCFFLSRGRRNLRPRPKVDPAGSAASWLGNLLEYHLARSVRNVEHGCSLATYSPTLFIKFKSKETRVFVSNFYH